MAPPPCPHAQHVLKLVCYLQTSAKKEKKDEVRHGKGLCLDDMKVLPIMSISQASSAALLLYI